jgi:two-component system sensor histidine kinase UhpB
LFDETGKFLRWNKNFETVSGYSAAAICHLHPLDFFDADVKQLMQNKIAEAFTKGMADVEAPFFTKSKENIPYYFTGWRIIYEDKPCLIGVGIDITGRKKAEKSFLDSQQRYKNLLDNMNDGFMVDDISGKITFANKKFLEIYGFTEDDITDLVLEDYFAPEYHETLRDRHNRRMAGEKTSDVFEYEGLRKDGKRIWLGVRVNPVMENGMILGTQSIIRDITELKKAEAALKESEKNYRHFFHQSPLPMFIYEITTYRILDVNEVAIAHYGYSKDEFQNMTVLDIRPQEEVEKFLTDAQLSPQGFRKAGIWKHRKKDGTLIDVEINAHSVEFSKKPCRLILVNDVTESLKMEKALAESENHLRTIVQAEPECVKLLGINGELQNMNPAGLAMIEADNLQQVKGKSVLRIIDAPYRNAFKELNQNVFKGKPGKMEFEITGLKGTHRWLETHAVPLKNTEGKIISLLGVTRDITERKIAEEKLRESNERYQFVNKATQDTIWEWNYLNKKGQWGEGIINTFGYSTDKLKYGENWLDEYVHPYDKEEVSRKLHTCIESGLENWQDEFRFRCADGTYKYVYDRGFILYDEQGKPNRMIGAMTDLTEQKRLERELAEQQIRQQKLITETTIQTQEKERNELGRELHDNINQILATVKMYLGMAKAKENIPIDLVGQSYEYVNEAMEEIRKLSHSLVAPSLGDIGLKEALQELADNINLFNDLEVQLLVDEKCYENDIDKNKELMIYRIVQEQLNNITKHAKANKVVITLKTDNDNLFLSVADNGVGFDSTQKSKGIGLKNISNRVEFYSGNLNIISAPGQGCTLEVYMPR